MTLLTNPKSNRETGSIKTPLDMEEAVRRRAYEFYQQRGYVGGHDTEDWLLAEQEINGRKLTTSSSRT
jgi:hypothetical protein